MWLYILAFGVVFFPLVLAGYSGHLATLALPEGSQRRNAIRLVWALAILGIAVFAVLQVFTYRSDKQRDSEDQQFKSTINSKLQEIIQENNPAQRKSDAHELQHELTQQHDSRNPTVLDPNDIAVSVCHTPLKLNQEVHSSEKFDGPMDCMLRISSNSPVILKGALLRMHVSSRRIKLVTLPQAEIQAADVNDVENPALYQLPIAQTLVKGGEEFPVHISFPHSSRRYALTITIIKEDGHLLGTWGIDIIPLHESD